MKYKIAIVSFTHDDYFNRNLISLTSLATLNLKNKYDLIIFDNGIAPISRNYEFSYLMTLLSHNFNVSYMYDINMASKTLVEKRDYIYDYCYKNGYDFVLSLDGDIVLKNIDLDTIFLKVCRETLGFLAFFISDIDGRNYTEHDLNPIEYSDGRTNREGKFWEVVGIEYDEVIKNNHGIEITPYVPIIIKDGNPRFTFYHVDTLALGCALFNLKEAHSGEGVFKEFIEKQKRIGKLKSPISLREESFLARKLLAKNLKGLILPNHGIAFHLPNDKNSNNDWGYRMYRKIKMLVDNITEIKHEDL